MIEEEGTLALGEDQIEQLAEALRAGRRLPPQLFPQLFQPPKEALLAYAGKSRRADVLADTIATPLQPTRTFGHPGETGWSNMLILGDNQQVLRRLVQMKQEGALRTARGKAGVRLCYIDPPFATRREFSGSQGERAYEDRVEGAQFLEFLRRRLILISELLSDDGSLFVHLDQRKAHYVKVVLDEIFGESNFRNEIILRRPISKNLQQQFPRVARLPQGHDSLLWYSARSSARFLAPEVPTASVKRSGYWHRFWSNADRPTMRYELLGVTPSRGQWKWSREPALTAVENYKRFLEGAGDDSSNAALTSYWDETGRELSFIRLGSSGEPENWYPPSDTQLADTIWDEVAVYENAKLYPTQKHTDLLEYLIEGFSEPGDIVLDAFAGAGTTMVAAEQLPERRRWIGIDSSKFSTYVTQRRLFELPDAASFTLFNAGLYDYTAVRDLPWPDYRKFALQLFQCRDEPVSVGGINFDGLLRDDRVLVYNFHEHPGATIGRPYLEDIWSVAGERIGDRCFIVAPAMAVEPYEDYVEVGSTRFYFLRIPYSIIAELHKRAFSELRQPASAADANATIDSVGFDFIQPPVVNAQYVRRGSNLQVQLVDFESQSNWQSEPKGRDDLAMVLIDIDYDGDHVAVDLIQFAEDYSNAGWQLDIPMSDVGDVVMVVFVDIYGNEYREAKAVDSFESVAEAAVAPVA
jgi:hypothetical protein